MRWVSAINRPSRYIAPSISTSKKFPDSPNFRIRHVVHNFCKAKIFYICHCAIYKKHKQQMKLEFSKQNICIESTLHHFQKILRYLIRVVSIVPAKKRPKLLNWVLAVSVNQPVKSRDQGLLIKHDVRSRDVGTKYAIWVKYPLSIFHYNYSSMYGTMFQKIKAQFKRLWNLNPHPLKKNIVKLPRSGFVHLANIKKFT